MAAKCGLGCTRWLAQFATGFPIDGVLSQKGVFGLTKPDETASDPALLFRADEARFRERATESGRKNAALLWPYAMGRVEKGWLRSPAKLDASGRPDGCPPRGYNIAT